MSDFVNSFGGLFSWENVSGPFQSAYDVINTERNWNAQKSNVAYQRRLQERLFQREDNAVQRRAADLKAAGFNPLLAAGGAASSGQAIATTAPHADRVDMLANAKMAMDISMTKSQQELLNSQKALTNAQADISRKTAELQQMTIDWYKTHPGYAPNVDTTKTFSGGLYQSIVICCNSAVFLEISA